MTNAEARKAGTVHLGGDYAELAATERDIHAARMPDRPFVLVGQQYLADPGRSVGNTHPLWAMADVPHGYTGDATEAITAQIERFAPGFRDRIVGHAARSTTQMALYNPNYVGGDIVTGAKASASSCSDHAPRSTRTASGTGNVYLFGGHPARARRDGMCGANSPPTHCGNCNGEKLNIR